MNIFDFFKSSYQCLPEYRFIDLDVTVKHANTDNQKEITKT